MSWALGAMRLKTSMKFSIIGEIASIISGSLSLKVEKSASVIGNILRINGKSTGIDKILMVHIHQAQ